MRTRRQFPSSPKLIIVYIYPTLFRDISWQAIGRRARASHTPVIRDGHGWSRGSGKAYQSQQYGGCPAVPSPKPQPPSRRSSSQWLTALKVPFPLNRLPFLDLSLGSLPIEETAISDAHTCVLTYVCTRDRRRRHSTTIGPFVRARSILI